MLKTLLRTVLPVAAAALFLAAIIGLGRLALEQLQREQVYEVRFSEIQCTPPPGMSRIDFLDEVQYVASMPGRMNLLEDDLPRRLAEAFGQHPWVEKVEQVRVTPPERVEVRLIFRRPALAVKWNGTTRVVDARGVLLPAGAPADGLPQFEGKPSPPRGPAGAAWGDEAVLAAAQAAVRPKD